MRLRLALLTVLVTAAPASALDQLRLDLAQRVEEPRRRIHRHQAPAAARPHREPVRDLQNAVKAASNPSSSSYGKYPSLSTLQSKYGASSSKRNGVINAFKPYGVTAKVDVTHLRVSATISVGNAQKMFGTKWNLYDDRRAEPGRGAAGRTRRRLPSGIKGNVDTIAGMRGSTSPKVGARSARRAPVAADGGTPTRTGTPAFGCAPTSFPSAVTSDAGPVPEPDPHRVRDRAAAGGRPARGRARASRSSARRRRRQPTSTRSATASASRARRCRSTTPAASSRSSRARWTR